MSMQVFLPESDKQPNIVDILLVTGDAYIDHPSFGVAIIARVLENKGYSVCIASQIEYYNPEYLHTLPEVKYFIGVTSGNLDSVVANYSSLRNERKDNPYSVDGEVFFKNGLKRRPDRAVIVYTSFLKQRYKNIPIVLGGLEASIRRLCHYDYIQQKLRQSILSDAKADILVYGMGERAIVEIAEKIKNSEDLFGIYGTALRIKLNEIGDDKIRRIDPIFLSSIDEINKDHSLLIKNTDMLESNMVYDKASPLIQKQNSEYVLCFTPQRPLMENEMDEVYSLPYKKDFPEYCTSVPAWNMINSSITTHRGCYGKCSFCAITIHQGALISQRSSISVIKEAKELSEKKYFSKTITDVGGPTANMYGTKCKIGWCKNPNCLFPVICGNLIIDKDIYKNLLIDLKKLPKVKNVFVSSGIRHDLALVKEDETEYIITDCTSGHLKIAPEHTDKEILKLMRKPDNIEFIKFIDFFEKIKKKYSLNSYILPYLILSFPGSDDNKTKIMGHFLNQNKIRTFQYQDFTPVPQTMATAMFFARQDITGKNLNIIYPSSIKTTQREILKNILTKKG